MRKNCGVFFLKKISPIHPSQVSMELQNTLPSFCGIAFASWRSHRGKGSLRKRATEKKNIEENKESDRVQRA